MTSPPLTKERIAELRAAYATADEMIDDGCVLCHCAYGVDEGKDPSWFCHDCAHEIAEIVTPALLDSADRERELREQATVLERERLDAYESLARALARVGELEKLLGVERTSGGPGTQDGPL